MKCRMTLPNRPGPDYVGPVDANGLVPVGTIIDHPQAYIKCKLGEAEPADDECREACGLSDDQIAFAHACAIEDRTKRRNALVKMMEDAENKELEDTFDDD